MKLALIAVSAAAILCLGFAQSRSGPSEQASWAPKPLEVPKYTPPHKPVTRLAELKKQHAGQTEWRQVIVDDDHLHGEYIQSAPGSKVSRRFHPDTREFWAVVAGQLRFDIEGQPLIVALRSEYRPRADFLSRRRRPAGNAGPQVASDQAQSEARSI